RKSILIQIHRLEFLDRKSFLKRQLLYFLIQSSYIIALTALIFNRFTIFTNPFARVGDRCSCKPISEMKCKSVLAISSGDSSFITRINKAMIPFVMMASESAVNFIFPSMNSDSTQTRD